ncbi:MAG: proline--tRNA ligase, partial [Acidobacteria bacterium]
FILAGWNGDAATEARIKEETKATIRVIPMGEEREAACVLTGEKGREVFFAQAY